MDQRARGFSIPDPGLNKGKSKKARFASFKLSEDDNALLQRLPEAHRRILTVHGRYAEIGEELHLAPGTVRSRLHRARSALVKLREEQDSEPESDTPGHEDQA